jgi:hypothetical protein
MRREAGDARTGPAQFSLASRHCDDLDDAEIAAAHLVARARELHRSQACGAGATTTAIGVA